jgi:tripartite ATP-independent transporter DctM subunit
METAGLWMLGLVAVLIVATGLPAFVVLVGVAVLFAAIGAATGAISVSLLTALPARLIGLLENDLLQALPLYILIGALLNWLPLADILFRAGNALFSRTRAAPVLSAIGLGALLAPMNGSVGASVAMLSRTVQPRLLARGTPPAQSLATVCVSSTLGVVVPPSLVLILLGDAMLRAHTEAVNVTKQMTRIVNTQDIFRGALVPAGLFLALCLAVAWWTSRRAAPAPTERTLTTGEWLTAGFVLVFIVVLLGGVAGGYLYAVEAAATGAFALFAFGLLTRALTHEVIDKVLRNTMAVTGALFALFVAATTFTLVFRTFDSDVLLARLIQDIPGGALGCAVAVLAVFGLCAFVLDAFEIIFVIVPIVMPPLLTRVPDAVWMASATMLVLQASFLIPPFGYAVMMARTGTATPVPTGALVRSLAPYLAAQFLVLATVVAFPSLTHVIGQNDAVSSSAPLSDDEVDKQFPEPPPPDDE